MQKLTKKVKFRRFFPQYSVFGKFAEYSVLVRSLCTKYLLFISCKKKTLKIAVTRGLGVPALKTAMEWFGYYGGPVRRPLLPLNSKEETSVKKAFEDEGFLT